MKKLTIIICAIAGTLKVNAQAEEWLNVELGQFGFIHSKYTMNTLWFSVYDQVQSGNSKQTIYLYGPSGELKINRPYLREEFYFKNAYIDFDLTVLSDMVGLLVSKKMRAGRPIENYTGHKWGGAEAFPMRLAFGGFFTKNFGFYGGAQYKWSSMDVDPNDGYAYQFQSHLGGHTRGFGAHGVFANKYFLTRYSFMYDWIRRAKRKYKGSAQTQEVSLFIALNSDKTVTLFGTYQWTSRKMNSFFGTTDDNVYGGLRESIYVPEISGEFRSFRVGVTLSGVMGPLLTLGAATGKAFYN